ncbi:hypothetical protein [Vibrio intestinalis]|uniref:hypothetical protein n=1 Tax=Vibrio intestinalis TaxID=2933291 RepID=UPI0021A8D207|nr:hypothetical protein [Vibrio intestinalis]
MKHFFPSSIMLTPFLVKRYQRDGDQTDTDETIAEHPSKQQATAESEKLCEQSTDTAE